MIGYQVKRLDQLIEATFDQATEAAGMSRREWQTLTTVIANPDADLRDALRPFWEGNDESRTAVLDGLVAREWITRVNGGYVVTEAGRAAHEIAARSVAAIRRRMADGITDTEFATLTGTLARMIDNLDVPR